MIDRGSNKAALDAVPAALRNDIGYKFARIQYLRRTEKHAEAAEVMASVPQLDSSHDLDEWWVERRLLARKLLDDGDAKRAYQVARDATMPERDAYRAEQQFTAGWIALRFLNDPRTAYAHFQKVGEGNDNPIALSRAAYWQGRAMEAMGRNSEARAHYQEAAKYPTAYYGQIARAKAGLSELTLNPPPALSSTDKVRLSQLEIVRAAEAAKLARGAQGITDPQVAFADPAVDAVHINSPIPDHGWMSIAALKAGYQSFNFTHLIEAARDQEVHEHDHDGHERERRGERQGDFRYGNLRRQWRRHVCPGPVSGLYQVLALAFEEVVGCHAVQKLGFRFEQYPWLLKKKCQNFNSTP